MGYGRMQLDHVSSQFRRHTEMMSNDGGVNIYLAKININSFELILLSLNIILYYYLSHLSEGSSYHRWGQVNN